MEFEKPTMPVQATAVLSEARQHMLDRAATYDKPEGERSMAQTVAVFNAFHGTNMSEAQGWHFQQILKDVRLFTRPGYHADSAEDCVAYAALKAEAKAAEGNSGLERLAADLEGVPYKSVNVPRFPDGGVVGLAPDELPVILRKGEAWVPNTDDPFDIAAAKEKAMDDGLCKAPNQMLLCKTCKQRCEVVAHMPIPENPTRL